MGRNKNLRKKFKKDKDGGKEEGDPRDGQPGYADIVKKNEQFERYYQMQKIVPDGQWEEFLAVIIEKLPSAFRITSFCPGQALELRKVVESDYFKDLISEQDGQSILKNLPWYPRRLAWQFNVSKTEIKKSDSFRRLQNFLISETESGYISRQEAVSMIPPLLMDVRPQHKVLDMCAAPGSKTAQIIELLHCESCTVEGVVVANDVDNKRCYMLVHQAKRLHSPCCVITNHDAGNMPNFYETKEGRRVQVKFDRILCDAPCSGDGTIRKNYDVWTKWNAANGNNFHGIQFRILKRGLELLKRDGRLVYSTCSFNPIENEAIVANVLSLCEGTVELVDVSKELQHLKHVQGLNHWLVMTRDMKVVNSAEEVEENLKSQIRSSLFPPEGVLQMNLQRCVRILPHHQDTGGFFVAVLTKKTDVLPWENENKEVEISEKEESGDKTEGIRLPYKKMKTKRKPIVGHSEDPFIFFNTGDVEWPPIKDYYKISDSFPLEQLVYRCKVGKKRNIYYLTDAAKRLITENPQIKIINAGVRLFSRSEDHANSCGYRVSQEGLFSLFPFIKQDNTMLIGVDVVKKILSQDNVPMGEFEEETREKFQRLKSGCCILVYQKLGGESELTLPIAAWKGHSSMRAYICKNERIHFLRVCGADVDHIEPYRKE